MPVCLDEKITLEEFRYKYQQRYDCPEFEAGEDPKSADNYVDKIDVMKAIGLVAGKPSQRVEVLFDGPWSITLAERAHREASFFLELARHADYLLTHPGGNDPSRGEYVDLNEDLEPVAVP